MIMIKYISILLSLLFVCSCEDKVAYEWSNAENGGGGYILGMYQDPVDNNILYSRCDVAGIFKSIDGGLTWFNINNGCTKYYHNQVRSFAQSKQKPNVLFRCSGALNDRKTYGDIMKSSDSGASWYIVNEDADFFGNGYGKFYGELIDVSPFDSNVIVSGSYSKGLFISLDEGENWKNVGFEGISIGVVKFHPTVKGKIYVGTRRDYPQKELLNDSISNSSGVGMLLVSDDNGENWSVFSKSMDYDIVDIAFDYSNPDLIYLMSEDAVYKTTDGGKTLTKVLKGKKALYQDGFAFVYTHPLMPNVVFSAYETPALDSEVPDLPIIVSKDCGENWEFFKNYNFSDFSDIPDYISTLKKVSSGISKLLIDRDNTNIMYFSNWYGVCKSVDGGDKWSGNNYKGLTTTCIENVVADPIIPGKAYFTCADVVGFCSVDTGKTYSPIGRTIDEFIHNGTAFCPSRHKKNFILSGISSWPKSWCGAGIVKSDDGGKNIEIVKRLKPGLFVQAIKESYFKSGEFYAFIDGDIDKGAGVLITKDWGETWETVTNPFPKYVKQLPHRTYWIETELLPITSYQQKNVCGCDALLAMDPFDANTIYIGEWTEGFYVSKDKGATWKDCTSGLPLKSNNDTITTLVTIKCDEAHPGTVYAGFVKAGLWRTSDYGENWEKIFPKDNIDFNASSIVVGGMDSDELYVACEPLYWSEVPSSIYYSNDRGNSWIKISDDKLGPIRWKGLAIDKSTGTLYGVSNGNGVFRGVRLNK